MKLPRYEWARLQGQAEEEVRACLQELPDELRSAAESVPVLYRKYHPNAPHIDPEAMYILGEYIAQEDALGGMDESGVIALYLGAIAWYCEDEKLVFVEEIRTTFLHELGHHFGWDEAEVEERGL
ncbi:metallopeptidase family protein [Pelagicoccus albus]|uniref:Metallopeptidase family protein n=1 Tax=Pelagicoccus albus TaxID=415222 RepID=A0A7X1B5J7_9BACT|nr:metallopeptidase family protein [Pelagicoccus albus]MBC2606053.1 metallopeptidase family protein [Pelagicoccus albus]